MSVIHRMQPQKKVGFQTMVVGESGIQGTTINVAIGFRANETDYTHGTGGGGAMRIWVQGSSYTTNTFATILVPPTYVMGGGGLASLQANLRFFSNTGTQTTRGGSSQNTWLDLSTYPSWHLSKSTLGTGTWRFWMQLRDKASTKLISNVYGELQVQLAKTGTFTCPDPEMRIELADGSFVLAKELKVGMLVKAMHEKTKEWGSYKVTVAESSTNYKVKIVFTDGTEVKCSSKHRFFIDDTEMIRAMDMTKGYQIGGKEVEEVYIIGEGEVISIEVEDAHTYMMEGFLCHNGKP